MRYHVLVIDDEPSICELIPMILTAPRYQTMAICDIDNLQQTIAHFKPHIIILDIRLGLVDGCQVCRDLKSAAATSHIPIILLTAAIVKAGQFNAGQDAIMEKPFDIDLLESLVWNTIQKKLRVIPDQLSFD